MNRFENWAPPPDKIFPKLTAGEWVRAVARAVPLAVLVFGGLLVLLLVRFIEAPLFRASRPITPSITKLVCRNALRILGIRYIATGTPMTQRGAMVSNHSSWLDIFVLNAGARVYFVSKSEVAGWPGIGWLARATGTVFIRRLRADARAQMQVFKERLMSGHQLLFFPEGTSTDGLQVIPFKSTLFAAFMLPKLQDTLWIQPVSVMYMAPDGTEQSFYGWWGDMEFAPHLLSVLATRQTGGVVVTYHTPLCVAEYESRKALAYDSEMAVRSGFGI